MGAYVRAIDAERLIDRCPTLKAAILVAEQRT